MDPNFLKDREVLFVIESKLGIYPDGDCVGSGTVIDVCPQEEEVVICFLHHFYKSATERVPFSHILAVHDEQSVAKLKIDAYSGIGHDLRDKHPFGTHPLAAI